MACHAGMEGVLVGMVTRHACLLLGKLCLRFYYKKETKWCQWEICKVKNKPRGLSHIVPKKKKNHQYDFLVKMFCRLMSGKCIFLEDV